MKALAEASGWRVAFPKSGPPHKETTRGGILLPYRWVNEITHERAYDLPDFLNSLDAMARAEDFICAPDDPDDGNGMRFRYCRELYIVVPFERQPFRATAAQRAEALLKALDKWTQ